MPLINPNDLSKINFNLENYDGLFKEYREDLENYIKAISGNRNDFSTYAKRYLLSQLEAKWIPVLGFNASRISSDISELQTPKTDFQTSLKLKEALSHYESGSSWVIPNLLRDGALYILAGEPKAGKSLLLYFLMYSVCVTSEFLGRPVKTGKVLYIQLEENLGTIGERLFMAGFGNSQDETTSLIVNFDDRLFIERSFDITIDIEWLIKKIQQINPTLVIIDSLRAATLNSSQSENSNEFGKLVYRLQQVFNFTNTCGLIVHHMNKLGSRSSNTNIIERLSGHTSIAAATSGLIGLSSEETEDGRIMTMKTLPRDGESIRLTYKMITDDLEGLWKLVKLGEDGAINNPFNSKIIRFLADNVDKLFTAKQIANYLTVPIDNVKFKDSLTYLFNSRIIVRKFVNQKFQFMLHSDSQWLVDVNAVKDMFSAAALDANNLLRCYDKSQIRDLISDWDDTRRQKAIRELAVVEKDRVRGLIKSYEYEINEEVIFDGEKRVIQSVLSEAPGLDNSYLLDNGEQVQESQLQKITEEVENDIQYFDIDELTPEEDGEMDTLDEFDEIEL